jgi:hypothetical protein
MESLEKKASIWINDINSIILKLLFQESKYELMEKETILKFIYESFNPYFSMLGLDDINKLRVSFESQILNNEFLANKRKNKSDLFRIKVNVLF